MRDILSDYKDFFTSGTADGKSEAELCAEFGPPEQAARELKSESETDTPKSKRRTQAIACTAFAVLLVFIFVGHIGPNSAEYVGVNEIASCFLRAILPNLAAAGVTWVSLKIVSVRKAAARRVNPSNQSEIS